MKNKYCEFDWRPIRTFSGQSCQHKARAWDGGFDKTLAALKDELERNDIDSVVVETFHSLSDYTMGNRPKSGINPSRPSVQIVFMLDGVEVCIPSSMYADWVQNLKAIQMTLRGRRLEREKYGCATMEQQYRGHAQLPTGGTAVSELANTTPDTPMKSARLLITLSKLGGIGERDLLESPEIFHNVYKAARLNSHPDKGAPNSSDEMFDAVEKARTFILEYKGW